MSTGRRKIQELEKTILYRSPRQGGILSPKLLRYLCGFSISHLSTHFLHVTMTYGFYFVGGRPGGGVLLGISGWGCALGPWDPQPIPELVQLNFATLY